MTCCIDDQEYINSIIYDLYTLLYIKSWSLFRFFFKKRHVHPIMANPVRVPGIHAVVVVGTSKWSVMARKRIPIVLNNKPTTNTFVIKHAEKYSLQGLGVTKPFVPINYLKTVDLHKALHIIIYNIGLYSFINRSNCVLTFFTVLIFTIFVSDNLRSSCNNSLKIENTLGCVF